jgi:DNA-binding NarL/FixJ family response regulator
MLVAGISPRSPRAGRVRVLIVHADATCGAQVAKLLRASEIDVVDVVPDSAAAVRVAQELDPDLVLLAADGEPAMPPGEATRRLAAAAPLSRVLLFGGEEAEEELEGTLHAGAAGYVRVDGRAGRLDVTVRIAIALIAYREAERFEDEQT